MLIQIHFYYTYVLLPKINVNYSGIPASWKIVETANENRYVNFENRGTSESSINFRSANCSVRYVNSSFLFISFVLHEKKHNKIISSLKKIGVFKIDNF